MGWAESVSPNGMGRNGTGPMIFGPKLDGQGRIGRSPDETANVILILTLQYNRENKVSVDEMKGIVTNVATHRGDIEKMVEKIIEVGWLVTDDLCDIHVIIDI